jgi:hypothetical protein
MDRHVESLWWEGLAIVAILRRKSRDMRRPFSTLRKEIDLSEPTTAYNTVLRRPSDELLLFQSGTRYQDTM